jgi:hypothetical protein
MNRDTNHSPKDLQNAVKDAMDDLPILSRLEFVKNLIFDKGGNRAGVPQDTVLVTACDVLDGVIDVLKKHPRAARLREPEP